jgi:hypothetical protein
MGIGENSLAVDDNARAFDVLGTVFGPWSKEVRGIMDSVDLDDEISHPVLGKDGSGRSGDKAKNNQSDNASVHGRSFFPARIKSHYNRKATLGVFKRSAMASCVPFLKREL